MLMNLTKRVEIGSEYEQIKAIQQVLSSFPEVEQAILFGRGAKVNFKTRI